MKPHSIGCPCHECVAERFSAAASTNTGVYQPPPEMVLIPVALRDYFAAKALQGILASPTNHIDGHDDHERHTQRAFKYADAMLKERAKGVPS